ncbi:MAG: N-acetylmuramoyl-L-alanine amidase, partial [Candidatus Acidiferrales bacterium]
KRQHAVARYARSARKILLFFQVVLFDSRRKFAFLPRGAFLFLACCLLCAGLARPQAQPQQQNAAPPPASNAAPPAQTPPPRPTFTVVLDPGHGGTDTGARGSTGAVEKDLTLALARATRSQLLQQGMRVILTREGDQDPSFDDRAATANAPRLAILISFHVSSTGQVGTARAYSYLFSSNVSPTDSATPDSAAPSSGRAASHLIPWDTAQQGYVDASHRLAEFIQTEFVQKFPGSPASSTAFPIRDLRSVAAPAVAVELSSVSVADPHALDPMIMSVAESVARAVAEFRPGYEAGTR